jgi:cell division protease FtsH
VKKVSIIPRGLAGGYTFTPPLEDRHYWTRTELISEIARMLGGRASEEISLSEVTTGAQNDLGDGDTDGKAHGDAVRMSLKWGI